MEFLKSIVIDNETIAADGIATYDLPVNPVSHLILTICCLNVTDEATIANLCELVTNVHVLHRGTTVLQMSSADLHALNHILLRKTPITGPQIADDNGVRYLSHVIPFGRKLYDPNECFPQSRRGELQIQLDCDIETTEADGLILQLEAVELYGANPSRYLKASTLTLGTPILGFNDLPLPIGNPHSGILLFGTTIPTTTTWTATIEQLELLADNKERYFASTNWESLRGELINRCGHEFGYQVACGDDHIPNYAFLDFDPRQNDQFLFNTAGLNALILRITAGDTEELRAIPLELQGVS